MKKIIFILLFIVLSITTVSAQHVNWKWIALDHPHHAHLNVGYDFSISTQIGYSYLANFAKPTLFTLDYSLPMGENLLDDFKIRLGGQIAILERQSFIMSVKLFGNLKRYETSMLRMTDFGGEASILLGYYRSGWHIATECGFLQPIASHIRHFEVVKENYPSIQDGWYTSSGGYLFYGIQGSKSFLKHFDASFRFGFTNAWAANKDALLPYYTQIGIIKRF